MASRVVLLFCHGGSLHKGVWAPIIRRLRAAGVRCECLAIDWRYHGVNACDDEPATLFYESQDPGQPRVAHPANHWPQWATEQLQQVVTELKSGDAALGRTTRIIGVGHSMGAATLLNLEVVYPGTFEGLVLFEPTLSFELRIYGGAPWAKTILVASTLAREDTWNSNDEALAYARSASVYRRWHPESLDAFLKGSLRPSRDGEKVRLATPLLHEAALYCHEITNYTRQQLAGVRCRVVFEYGALTAIFNVFGVRALVDALPDQFSLAEPIDKLSHQSIVEDPDRCAERILLQLQTIPAFQTAHGTQSRL